MSPYQFYQLDRFPEWRTEPINSHLQKELWGEPESIDTEIAFGERNFEVGLDELRIKTQIEQNARGYIKDYSDGHPRMVPFTQYLQPVDFHAYHHAQENILIFRASRDVGQGTLVNISESVQEIAIREMRVDFNEVEKQCLDYLAAWFKGISARVTSASLSGNNIQDDPHFSSLKTRGGRLSSVTLPWVFEGEHQVIITSNAAIVIRNFIKDNVGLELRVVMDVYNRLLKHVWIPKPIRKSKARGIEAVEEEDEGC